MPKSIDPLRFLIICVGGWKNQQQRDLIDYLREENKVLREQMGGRRLRYSDDQHRRLAARAKGIGRKLLSEVATVVTPETLLRWHRQLIAAQYDGTARRKPGRPTTKAEIEVLVVRMATENRSWGYSRISERSRTSGTNSREERSPTYFRGMDLILHQSVRARRVGKSS